MAGKRELLDRIKGCLSAMRGCELMTVADAGTPPEKDERKFRQVWGTLRVWHLNAELVKTYLRAGRRITAEEWGESLKTGKVDPLSAFLDTMTVVELLKEGMHPRMTGMLNVITGTSLSISPVVGLYNAGDPEQAYLDGYDIASVIQRDKGVESASVFASAIAEAVCPNATVDSVISAIHTAIVNCDSDFRRSILVATRGGKHSSEEFIKNPETIKDWLSVFVPANNWIKTESQIFCIETAILLFMASKGDIELAMKGLKHAQCDKGVTASLLGALCGALNGYSKLPPYLHDDKKEPASLAEEFCRLVGKKFAQDKKTIQVIEKLAKKKTKDETYLFNRIFGSTLAGAIGNAMGSPYEWAYWEDIEKKYGRVDTITQVHRLDTEDDLQMALHIAQAFIDKQGVATSKDLAKVWMRDMVPERFFHCMRNSYDLIKQGYNPRFTGHGNYVTGSTLMCMQPVGFYNAGDPHKAYVDAIDISYMYQRGLDVDAACVFAAMVAEAMRPGATIDSICKTAVEYSPARKMTTFDRKPRKPGTFRGWVELTIDIAKGAKDVFSVRKKAYDKLVQKQYCPIDPLEFFCLTLAIFIASKGNVEQAVMGGANMGQDADSIASLNGVLSGALNGWNAIPKRWVDLVGPRAFNTFKKTSKELSEVILNKKLPMMKTIQGRINT